MEPDQIDRAAARERALTLVQLLIDAARKRRRRLQLGPERHASRQPARAPHFIEPFVEQHPPGGAAVESAGPEAAAGPAEVALLRRDARHPRRGEPIARA